ncbi:MULTISPECIES: multidrug efflux MFS transporter [Serratia]|uniref:multidrug efflux MFS transporter n=1 Tax=Serratia TaxID=613 RepID=UPI0007452A3F|nr:MULTISPECIES: multidrug efflux MFS transporter [Serratia]APS35148.1 multidrug transporter [Serratia marcescens]MBH2681043.1 multidrug efflux MFS transporter [Serratia marcescens]MBH2703843.1 multidrug efflux MFS transporter [Serratia marcescens]MBH3189768.1 multidrug efflux MFS transporter [Serratia marcescens]MBN5252494.1 multidrug efflux MFS transporter [Serratia marcescens]
MNVWKVNLISAWFGCFLTGLAMSQILPFLPLYIETLGVKGHSSLNLWSGLVFSGMFFVSAMVSPLWGSLADRKGRKLMLLRASLGMAVATALQGMVNQVWQLFALRALMGLASGYIPNAMALIASQAPRDKSGWALGMLSTGQITGMIGGPLFGGMMADHLGLRMIFYVTSGMMFINFLLTLLLIKERHDGVGKTERFSGKRGIQSLPQPMWVVSLFICTLMIQLANSSISPILTLFIRALACNTGNIAFISGMIAAAPGIAALVSAPHFGRLGDRIGAVRILIAALLLTAVLLSAMACVRTPLQLGVLRFLLGFADGALMPALQTLLLQSSSEQTTGRIFGYNQSFMYLGNVCGPLLGAGVSALAGYRWVFVMTSIIVMANVWQLYRQLQKRE